MPDRSLPFHHESAGPANAPLGPVFAFLDDLRALAGHMGESSMMMLGSRMSINVDAGGARVSGSKIRTQGRMMGIRLSLEEVATKRQLPAMTGWKTIGTSKLLVISHDRMGFEMTCHAASLLVHVFIDYSLPISAPSSWLGHLLGAVYARCRTRQMVMGAARHFT